MFVINSRGLQWRGTPDDVFLTRNVGSSPLPPQSYIPCDFESGYMWVYLIFYLQINYIVFTGLHYVAIFLPLPFLNYPAHYGALWIKGFLILPVYLNWQLNQGSGCSYHLIPYTRTSIISLIWLVVTYVSSSPSALVSLHLSSLVVVITYNRIYIWNIIRIPLHLFTWWFVYTDFIIYWTI